MNTERMIRVLEGIEVKHKHDKVFTGQLNIAQMAHDVRKQIEELKLYEDTGLTPEQIMELKERDTAKASMDADENLEYFKCPNCGMTIYASDDLESHHFCLNCGQRIKWED